MIKRLLISIFLILLPFSAFSVPAYPYFITLTQPDGEEITLKMKGDERSKWMESEDGYSLLYDQNKNIVYAILDEKGDMIPSTMKVSNVNRSPEVNTQLKKIPKGLQYSKEQQQILRQIRKIKEQAISQPSQAYRSPSGIAKVICTLIQFPDKPFTRTLGEFVLLMHQSGYTLYGAYGSVRDFYLENSYGKLDLQVTVTGIYTASKNWKYYGENDENMQDKYSTELAKEAAVFAFSDQSINPADYDNDGDGYIDAFHVFYAGYGEEAGGSTDCIWAHKYGFYPRLTFGNKYLATYSCSPELRSNRNSNITHIGVICHELGHIFGAPDFYDTDDGEFVGTGEWDLMAGGSWNGDGARPAHINMYQKIEYGWVEPVELNAPQNIIGMQNSANFPEAYIIRTSTLNEYYVLENRQKQGFDTSVPGHGLLIYHVSITQNDINRNIVNNGHPQKVYPVCSVNTNVIPSGPNSYGSINSAQCPFPGTSNKRTFGKTSIPAMLTWSGEEVLKPITEITEANQLISFQFMETLLNLTASVSVKQVTIQWKTPDVLEEIAGYNIYCDDQFLNFTTGNAYRNTVRENGAYIYGVSIKYTDGSESAQEKIEVIVTSTAMNTPVKSPTLVFPNPVEKGGLLTVDLDDSYEKAKLLFYDLSGRLIQTLALLPDNQYAINLPPGIYLLKIINKQKTEILKLTIK